MTDCNLKTPNKQLVMVVKTGPSFEVDEVKRAHAQLDQEDIPREMNGWPLSLDNRIALLLGKVEAERICRRIEQNVHTEVYGKRGRK